MKWFTTEYETIFEAPGLTLNSFLVLSDGACDAGSLSMAMVSPTCIVAYTQSSFWIRSSEITIRSAPEGVHVKSVSEDGTVTDFGKNKKIVVSLIESFLEHHSRLTAEEISTKYENVMSRYAEPHGLSGFRTLKT